MIINILRVLLRAEHFVVLQRLPTTLLGIMCRVENDAMRVQVRIERA